MRIALFQNDPRPGSLSRNASLVFSAFAELSRAKVDLVVLPEMWPIAPGDVEAFSQKGTLKEILEEWQAMTSRYRLASCGGFPRFAGKKIYNSLFFFDHRGKLLATYDKIHLFSPQGENLSYAQGKSPRVVKFGGFKIGLSICYDLRFPELYRAEREMGAEVFLVPAQWPAARRDHFSILLRARAVENLAYVIGVNRTGHYRYWRKEYRFAGGSSAYHPFGDPLWVSGERVGYGIVEIQKTTVTQIRRYFPSWNDRAFSVSLRKK